MTNKTNGLLELPKGWAWATLGELCEIVGGVTVDAKRRGEDLVEVPYLRVANVQRGCLDLSVVKTILVPRGRSQQLALRPNDILINEGGDKDKVGRGWVWSGEIEACIHQNHVFRARPLIAGMDGRWISAYANELGRRYFFEQTKQTTNLASISQSKVKSLPVPVAPLAEQQRIWAVVEQVFGEIEAGEQELGKAHEALEAYRRSVLKAAVTGELTAARREKNPATETGAELLARILRDRRATWEKAERAKMKAKGQSPKSDTWKARYVEPEGPETSDLPELPERWIWASLGQICEIVGGVTVDAKRKGDGLVEVPYLRVANVQRGYLDLTHVKTIRVPQEWIEQLRLKPNDLLLNEGGDKDKVGRGWVWNGNMDVCIHQNHVFRARPCTAELDGRYLSAYANEVGRQYFFAEAKQTTNLASISMRKVKALPVPLPPASEIPAIVDAILSSIADVDAMEAIYEKAALDVASLRQSILSAAFAGKLVPQDPVDEPASVLLERLRTAKAEAGLKRRERPTSFNPADRTTPNRPRGRPRKVQETVT